jgi:type III secretion protein R
MDLSSFTPGSALILIVGLALAPFFAVMVTSFTKIVVVLSLLRNALGLQQVPPNIVLNGLALVLTLYVMQPVGRSISDAISAQNANAGSVNMLAAAEQAKEPLREFLLKHSRPAERAFFLRTSQRIDPARAQSMTDRDLVIVIPSFVVNELSVAFQIGFLIYLPFLVIDLVVSNILLAMGMMMLSPTTISLPFKLLLFVLVDGWVKLSHGLVLSYV